MTNLRNGSLGSSVKDVAAVSKENECFTYETRKCDDSVMGCTGADTQEKRVPCPTVKVEPNYSSK